MEDNPGDARLIREMLIEEKFPVENLEVFDRLSKGLERLSSGYIDAILLDLGLPDSQGISTFEKMYSAAQKIPILILTAFKDDVLALEAMRMGAQDYLIKGKTDGALLLRAIAYAIEREKADEAVKRQAELIDLSPDAIMIKKPDDTITFWSLGAEKLYGWAKDEAMGQKTNTLLKTSSVQPVESIFEHLKQEGKWSGELTHHTKGGRALSIQSYWQAKFDQQGKVIEIFESNVDITERKDAERLAAIGATAGMVGHDIRNPLQSIIGELFLSKKEIDDMPETDVKRNLQESLASIDENLNYINKIVSDLQEFAKPTSISLEDVNLEKLVSNVLSTLKIPENIETIQKIHPDFPNMKTDPAAMKRVLTNLCLNAIQAMPYGGKLVVSTIHKDGEVFISVKDTGVGIPDDIKDKLFKPLTTNKSKGQGFGLAVVKKLAEALNGKIIVESQVGMGTEFTLKFPTK